jgi:hypothetical protein
MTTKGLSTEAVETVDAIQHEVSAAVHHLRVNVLAIEAVIAQMHVHDHNRSLLIDIQHSLNDVLTTLDSQANDLDCLTEPEEGRRNSYDGTRRLRHIAQLVR